MRSNTGMGLFSLFALIIVTGGSSTTHAADHRDAPFFAPANNNQKQDINDIYAFLSPTNARNLVLIMTVNPNVGIESDGTLDPNTVYEFLIDTTGNAQPDINYAFYFSKPNLNGQQNVVLQSGRATLARGQTDQNIKVTGGGTLRVGIFDDPFFFDPRVLSTGQTGINAFAGQDVTAIVLEIPRRNLRADNIGVWGITELNGRQLDRMGRPGINTVLISMQNKNAFNAGLPVNDQQDFRQEVINTITALGNGAQAAGLADILLPDILTIDTSMPTEYLNGRKLEDDVIDTTLDVLTNGAVTTDGVANDSNFSNTFPYLAPRNNVPMP